MMMMMGRIYSGNLSDYKDAIERLKDDHDVTVTMETFSHDDPVKLSRAYGEALRVVTRSGHVLVARTFEQQDSDVRINAQTSWLRKVHSDLQHWK